MTDTRSAKLRAVVVGTGFGCRIHVPALRNAGFEVAGLVGTNTERLARRAESAAIANIFTDLEEAIKKTGAVVVTVATPPDSHARLVLKALERGCHVICEKPMAFNATEARAMLAAAEHKGVIHLIGNEFRWQPDRALVGRAIADGLIGEPRFLTLTQYIPFAADPAARLPKWWFAKQAGGGWLGASGSHWIDQVRAWLGDFSSLSAALPTVSDRQNVAEDSFVLRFRTNNGVEGVIQQTAGAWGPQAAMCRVAGTKGTVWAEDGVVRVADQAGVRELAVPEDLVLPPAPAPAAAGSSNRFSHLELGPYTRLCEALRCAIEGGHSKTAVPLPTFRDGLACMQVLDAMRSSAQHDGIMVRVDR
jgi:predicted dehydrogenase